MIGTGIYIDDIEREYRAVAMLLGSISLVLLAGLGLIGYLVGRSVTRQLGGEPSMVVDIMQRVADGDLTVSAGQVKEGSLLHSLDRMVAALRQIVGEINRDANTLVNNAQQIATASDEVAKAAEHQSDATSAMAAFRASRLVCPAMSLITLAMLEIWSARLSRVRIRSATPLTVADTC